MLRETIEYALKLTGDTADKARETASGITDLKSAAVAGLSAVGALSAAALAAGTAFAGLASQVYGTVDQINTLAQASGLSTDMVAGLRLAAQASNKTLEQLVPKELAQHMLDAANGSKEAASSFKRLGVDVLDSSGHMRNTDVVLNELVTALYKVEDPALRSALAAKTMGEQGKQLLSAFSDPSALNRFTDAAKQFGIHAKVSSDASDRWWRATANLKLAVEDAGASIVAAYGASAGKLIDDLALGVVYVTSLLGGLADVMFTVRDKLIANAVSLREALSAAMRGEPIELNLTTNADFRELIKAGIEAAQYQALDTAEGFHTSLQAGKPGTGAATTGGAAVTGNIDQAFVGAGDSAKNGVAAGMTHLIAALHGQSAHAEKVGAQMDKLTTSTIAYQERLTKLYVQGQDALRVGEELRISTDLLAQQMRGLGANAMASSLTDALGALAGGLGSTVAYAIGGPIGMLVGAIIDIGKDLPDVVHSIISDAVDLVTGLPDIIVGVVEQVPYLIGEAVPAILESVSRLGPDLIMGLADQLPALLTTSFLQLPRYIAAALAGTIGGLTELFSPAHWRDIGDEFFAQMALGFDQFIRDLKDALNIFADKQGHIFGTSFKKGEAELFGFDLSASQTEAEAKADRKAARQKAAGKGDQQARSSRTSVNMTIVAPDGRTVASQLRDMIGTYGLNEAIDGYG